MRKQKFHISFIMWLVGAQKDDAEIEFEQRRAQSDRL